MQAMKKFPLVSILIPVFNREKIIEETVECCINQSYSNVEIVICDNKSTDGTWEIVQGLARLDNRIRIFQNESNMGPVENWRRCISEARGEYAKILWSDDTISQNYIEETVKLFADEVAFVLTSYEVFEKDIVHFKKDYKEKGIDVREYLEDILLHNKNSYPVSPADGIFRLKDVKDSLLLDIPNQFGLKFSKFGAGNDLLIFCLTALNYKMVMLTDRGLARFRSHSGSLTISNNLEFYYMYSKYYFINKYYPSIMSKFSSILFVKSFRNRDLLKIRKLSGRLSVRFLWDYVYDKVDRKLY